MPKIKLKTTLTDQDLASVAGGKPNDCGGNGKGRGFQVADAPVRFGPFSFRPLVVACRKETVLTPPKAPWSFRNLFSKFR
jgi:hypothetical protein